MKRVDLRFSIVAAVAFSTLIFAPVHSADDVSADTDVVGADGLFSAEELTFFEQKVEPLLREKCIKCHGPEKQRGGLRLDHRSFLLQGGDSGPAVDLEALSDSMLLSAIDYDELEMPPTGKLPDEQRAILSRWVSRGVAWPDVPLPAASEEQDQRRDVVTDADRQHWAYRPIVSPALPSVAATEWSSNPIDRFVLHRLESAQLSPNPPASRRHLLRRLVYDLTGLPPTKAEMDRFERDDRPNAYAHWVDELLVRPAYGEKWARHWLDLVRFAETNGYERDGPKANAWRYRDYVIRAFNAGKPYSEFVLEQLAGDELVALEENCSLESRNDRVIATGYYRMGIWDDEPADADQAFYDSLDDVVSTTSLVFMSTTVGCARCHDHKIDPIPQRDYYRMMGFFHNIYNDSKQRQFKKSPFTLNTQTTIASPSEVREYEVKREIHQQQVAKLESELKVLSDRVFETFSNPEKEDAANDRIRERMVRKRARKVLPPNEAERFDGVAQRLERLRRNRVGALPEALSIRENGRSVPATHVLVRGNAHAIGDAVEPGFLEVLTTSAGGGDNRAAAVSAVDLPEHVSSSGRRLAFAKWLVAPENPLTARVIVNRMWQYHFGRGLVSTSSDFGQYGELPTHPDLLDYLSRELVAHGWDLKWLHRLMLTSQVYQMSSADNADGLRSDPANRLMWRFRMRRLTAEELRDTVLTITGQLNREMYGPSVFSKLPDVVLQSASRPDAAWGKSELADQVRRSVYVYVKRSIADPVLASFDSADTDASCPVRFATTVPTQALTTLNGEFFNEQASIFARRVVMESGVEVKARVGRALELALARAPRHDELARGIHLIESWQTADGVTSDEALRYFCLLVLNLNETVYLD